MTKKALRRALEEALGASEARRLYASFDVVGDIAIIRIPKSLEHLSPFVAEAVMRLNKHITTVLRQASAVSGAFRLRGLEWVLGERKSETVHREHGCAFKVDLAKVYFSPRLQYERIRVARLVKPCERLVNLFAGVGCFSIVAAKQGRACVAFSIDLNSDAVKLMEENVRLNKVERRVLPIQGNAKEVVEERLRGTADRVIMPLPEVAYEYLEAALQALKARGGFIHYYDFVHAAKGEDPIWKVRGKVATKLLSLRVDFCIPYGRVLRSVGPNWFQVALDIETKSQRLQA